MTIFDVDIDALAGGSAELDRHRGQVVLVVNVASRCGLTPQYAGLQALADTYADRGLVVVGVPCNQFGDQEPGTDAEIQEFCSVSYDVTFPVLKKIDVNGPDAEPLFAYLRAEAPGDFGPQSGRLWEHISTNRPEMIGTDDVKWNFTKFLIAPDGQVVRRYEPTVPPEEIRADLDALLPARS